MIAQIPPVAPLPAVNLKREPMNTFNCIFTFSGQYVNVVDPDPDTINITDIAHALSMTNRFGGHTRRAYTVAQHSLLVAKIVPPEYKLHALLHDAAEAYFGDMMYPVKYLSNVMQGYRDLESSMQAAIYKKFGLGMAQTDKCIEHIRRADLIMLSTERRDLMTPDARPWPIIADVPPLTMHIHPVQQSVAEMMFLTKFKELAGMQ